MTRIALADDQALVRQGLRALLEDLGDIEVVVEAVNGEDLLQQLSRCTVDVIVADVRMPQRSGIGVVQALRARGDMTPVVLLTTFDEPGQLAAARQAGAQAFLLKDAAPEELKRAILKVREGQTLWSPLSPASISLPSGAQPSTNARLTEREADVLRLVAGGYSNKEIGRQLGISDGTVKNHLSEILDKLQARDRTHAVMKAIAARLL